ncbi:MAG: D-alanine--D-alanine ligase family protein [Candidatus Magasanikbacteria bacterium]|nr:D-alanine--D-alanine ligase family protein [Candidatus Magasanikbacteria bacterium]
MKTVGLFFGGLSNEKEISIISAKNIAKNFDYKKYKLILIYWYKDGTFYQIKDIENIKIDKKDKILPENFHKIFDIAFPITHGKYGEDGSLQGLFEILKIKYCGCRVLGSSLSMDKTMFKILMLGQKISQVKFKMLDFSISSIKKIQEFKKQIQKEFRLPIFIKPANSGSSVGITKVDKWNDLDEAIKEANKHDGKILVEEGLKNPKEFEVAILGNDLLSVSSPGELKLIKDFYDYDDKYKKGETKQIIPAEISARAKKEIQELAEKVYRLSDCRGFARVDFFMHKNKIYLNEINTLPGFTDISMYPMLMKNTGLTYKELINKIIELAY